MTTATKGFPISPRLVMTAAVADACATDAALSAFTYECLSRFAAGDEGDMSVDDKRANREAIKDGSRILVSYKLPDDLDGPDEEIWIITDAKVDGEWYCTTLLWPSDY